MIQILPVKSKIGPLYLGFDSIRAHSTDLAVEAGMNVVPVSSQNSG